MIHLSSRLQCLLPSCVCIQFQILYLYLLLMPSLDPTVQLIDTQGTYDAIENEHLHKIVHTLVKCLLRVQMYYLEIFSPGCLIWKSSLII